jgi:hypothetical protein
VRIYSTWGGEFDNENANSFNINCYLGMKRDDRRTLLLLCSVLNPKTFLIMNNLDGNLGRGVIIVNVEHTATVYILLATLCATCICVVIFIRYF